MCDVRSDIVRSVSAGGYDVIENAKIYSSLQDAIGDLQRVFATTVRPRTMTQIVQTPRSAAEEIITMDQKVGIMFGSERSGLDNEDIKLADTIISVPSFPKFSSLNLAQSVNIVSYEIWQAKVNRSKQLPEVALAPRNDGKLSTKEELDHFLQLLETSIEERSSNKTNCNQTQVRMNFHTSMRSLFSRVSVACIVLSYD